MSYFIILFFALNAILAVTSAADEACGLPSPDCQCADYCRCDVNVHTDQQLKADCLQRARLIYPDYEFSGNVEDADFGHHHHHHAGDTDFDEHTDDDHNDHGHSHGRRRRHADSADSDDSADDHGHAHEHHGHAHDGTEPESHYDHGSDEEEEEHDHDPIQEKKEEILDKCLHINFNLDPHPCNCHCSSNDAATAGKRRKRQAPPSNAIHMNAEAEFMKCYQEAFMGCNSHCTDTYQKAFESCKALAELSVAFNPKH